MENGLIKEWLNEKYIEPYGYNLHTITESELHELCLIVCKEQRRIDREVLIENNQLKAADIVYFNPNKAEL